jgi:hypothetical protein
MSDAIVFVLGAGFTRAFVPTAPLLVGDYVTPALQARFSSFSHATAVLDAAIAARSDGQVDLERLMSRLSGMPYDTADARRELELLERELKKELVTRLKDAEAAGVDSDKLRKFARFVLTKGASIVTFNYDDILDKALFNAREQTPGIHSNIRTDSEWHPDGGYGFYCRPSSVAVADSPGYMDRTRTLLLKLHGSLNWRTRLGEGTLHGPEAILHHEDWVPSPRNAGRISHRIESHLEPDPFIVPPVLVKSELTAHPVLRVVWELARERLAAATKIVFIGYSLPVTDLASRVLFSEALRNLKVSDVVQVVSLAKDGAEEKSVKDAYRSLFPGLRDPNFHFKGAWDWIERQVS